MVRVNDRIKYGLNLNELWVFLMINSRKDSDRFRETENPDVNGLCGGKNE